MGHGKKQILAGDIGGTKTLLAIFSENRGKLVAERKARYPSREYEALSDIISDFVKGGEIDLVNTAGGFGIACPCEGGICRTLNLPWVVNEAEIRERFGLGSLSLINDFEAVVHGVPRLPPEELAVLNGGTRDRQGNIAVLGAGTGLGEAFAVYDRRTGRYRVCPSEGGHADFAPASDQEIGLLEFLLKQYDHVSFERVLSGRGLVQIFSYLVASGSYGSAEKEADRILAHGDPPAEISRLGLEGGSEICVQALDLFVSIYGREAGNLALKILPSGGLYLAGGIAAKILRKLESGLFLESFTAKGRAAALLRQVPVYVVLNPEVGLIGAAAKALA
jgi:glucokinase